MTAPEPPARSGPTTRLRAALAGPDCWVYATVALLGLVALGLRLVNLDGHSVWLDEAYSLRDAASLAASETQAYHPPLYVLLLHLWTKLFGSSVYAARALSALFGALAVPLVFAVARSLAPGRRAFPLLSAAALAVLPQALWFSREARMYALWAFFFLLAVWGLLGLAAERPSRGRVAAYLIGLVGGQLSHHYMAFYAAALGLAALLLIGAHPWKKTRHELWRWFRLHLPLGLIGVGVVIWVLAMQRLRFDQLSTFLYYASHVEPSSFSLAQLAQLLWFDNWAFRDHGGGAPLLWEGRLLLLAIGLLLLAWWRERGSSPRQIAALALLLVLPFVTITALPIRHYARVLMPTAVLLPLLIGYACALPPRHLGRRGWIVVVLALAALGLSLGPYVKRVYTHEIEPWNTVCERISREERPQDVVLVTARYMAQCFELCFRGKAPVHGFRRARATRRHVRDHQPVWLIYSHAWESTRHISDDRRAALAALKKRGFAVTERWRPGPLVEVYRLTPPRGGRKLVALLITPNSRTVAVGPHRVVAHDARGKQLWSYRLADGERALAAVAAPDSAIYLRLGGALRRIDTSGKIAWSHPLGGGARRQRAALVATPDSGVVVETAASVFIAVDSSGRQRWQLSLALEGQLEGPLRAAPNGLVLAPIDRRLFAIDGDGKLRWQRAY